MFRLQPSEIYYSQDSINNIFTGHHIHSGKQIGTTLDELIEGHTRVEQIKSISVKYINGKWFTSDNRRLWVFKYFELLGGCTYIPVIRTRYIDPRKFTTCNGGECIIVRGNPGGKWYYKLISNPAKYHNYLRFNDTCNRISCASKENHVFVSEPKSVFRYHEQPRASRAAQTAYTDSASIPYPRLIDGQLSSTVENADQTLPAESLHKSVRMFGLVATLSSSNSTNDAPGSALSNYSEGGEKLVSNTTQRSSDFTNQNIEPSNTDKTAMHALLEASVNADSNKRSPSPISDISFMNTSVLTLSESNLSHNSAEEINHLENGNKCEFSIVFEDNAMMYRSTGSRLGTCQVTGQRSSNRGNTITHISKQMPLTALSNQCLHESTLESGVHNITPEMVHVVSSPSNISTEMRYYSDTFERSNLFKTQKNGEERYSSAESTFQTGHVTGQSSLNRSTTTLRTSKEKSLTAIVESGLNNTTPEAVRSVPNSSNMLKEMRNNLKSVKRSYPCSSLKGTTATHKSTQSTHGTFKSLSNKAKATLPTSQCTSLASFANQSSLSPITETSFMNNAPSLVLVGSESSSISAVMKPNSDIVRQNDISVNLAKTTSGIDPTPGQTAPKNICISSRLITDQRTIQSSTKKNTANSPTLKETSSAVVSNQSLVSPIRTNALKNNSPVSALSRLHSPNISSKIRNLVEIFEKCDLSTTQENITAHSKSARLTLKQDPITVQSVSGSAKKTMPTSQKTSFSAFSSRSIPRPISDSGLNNNTSVASRSISNLSNKAKATLSTSQGT